MTKKTKQTIGVYTSNELIDRIDSLAQINAKPRNKIINELLGFAVERAEELIEIDRRIEERYNSVVQTGMEHEGLWTKKAGLEHGSYPKI